MLRTVYVAAAAAVLHRAAPPLHHGATGVADLPPETEEPVPRATPLSHILAAFARKISHRRDVHPLRASEDARHAAPIRGHKLPELPRLPELRAPRRSWCVAKVGPDSE